MLIIYRTYHPNYTAGVMPLPDGRIIYTVERPWVESQDSRAGKPGVSCIPEGIYRVNEFKRQSGADAWVLSNPNLGVYEHLDECTHTGDRFGCLIHVANHASELKGCIGPGLGADGAEGYMVTHSRAAMDYLSAEIFQGINEIGVTHFA